VIDPESVPLRLLRSTLNPDPEPGA